MYEKIKILGARVMLLLGESLIWLEQRTKRGLQVYLISGVVLFFFAWGTAYLIFKGSPRLAVPEEVLARAQTVRPPVIPSPPRYLFFNDYYFFEKDLDLEADTELILAPLLRQELDRDALKEELLEQGIFSKDQEIIDEELARLVR